MYKWQACSMTTVLLGAAILIGVLYAPSVCAAGTITITKATLVEKDSPHAEVSSGYAAYNRSVDFRADATCTCSCTPDLTYTWYFGDTESAPGKNVSHEYGSDGGGNRWAFVAVHCNNCSANATSWSSMPLLVSVITGIRVDRIGDKVNPTTDGRLCFDSERRVEGTALPAGVNGSNLIDWYLMLGAGPPEATLANHGPVEDPPRYLTLSAFPTSNTSWEYNSLSASIDGTLIPGQDNELKLTGAASYVWESKNVETFFDEEEDQNPGTGNPPNWFYYWKQTMAYYGTVGYQDVAGGGVCDFIGGSWQAFARRDGNESNDAGCFDGAEGIDFFANVCRHEQEHRLNFIDMWGATSDRVGDTDNDYLKNDLEATLEPGHPYDNTEYGTYADTFDYGEDPLRDCEDYALRHHPGWTEEDADDVDWAKPGHQW